MAYETEPERKARTLREMPLKGACGCRRGVERDNCPNCEGTGIAIDWRAYHARKDSDAARGAK